MANIIVAGPNFGGLAQSIENITGQLSPATQRVYRIDAEMFASWLLDHGLMPETVTRSDMIAYRYYLDQLATKKDGKPYGKDAKQRRFVVACRIMKELFFSKKISTNVAEELKHFKTGDDETTHIALSKSQAVSMLQSVNTSTIAGKRDYALLLFLVKTGVRREEAVSLNLSQITMRDGHHVAIVEHGKGDKTRVVKLRVDVMRALNTYTQSLPVQDEISDEDYPLFVRIRRGDHPTVDRLTAKSIEIIVEKYAPIDEEMEKKIPLTPHGLRATFATLALEEGAPLHQVQYAMGHRDPRTTEHYQKRKLNLDANAVDVLNF